MTENELLEIEARIQYAFNNKMLLKQAFMINATNDENDPNSSEILRTIGKRAINFSLTEILTQAYGYYTASGLYRVKGTNASVNDMINNLYSKDLFARQMELLGLVDFAEFNNGMMFDADRRIFEAVIGAISLDCGFDMEIINDSLSFLLDVEYYTKHGFEDLNDNFVVLVNNWAAENNKSLPYYEYLEGKEKNFLCKLYVSAREDAFIAEGETKSEARMSAAKKCYDYLVKNNEVLTLKNIKVDFNESNAMEKLEDLAMQGYFSMPDYNVKEEDNHYKAVCMIDETDITTEGFGDTDTKAINEASFKMLRHILGYEN